MRSVGKFVIGLVAGAIPGLALGADLPARTIPAAPAPTVAPFSWNGAYFGLEGGYSWANASGSYSISSATLAALPPIIPTIDAAGSHRLNPQGGLFGGELGYNWQAASAFVVGVEGDISWSGLSGTMTNGGIVPIAGGPYSITQKFTSDWFATVRGRVGFAPIDRLLIFGTGGLAIAALNYSSAFTDSFNENENVSVKATKAGWVIGGGVEYALAGNWSAKAEYLYSQFPALNTIGSTTLTDGTIATAAHSSGAMKINTARIGLNYHFD